MAIALIVSGTLVIVCKTFPCSPPRSGLHAYTDKGKLAIRSTMIPVAATMDTDDLPARQPADMALGGDLANLSIDDLEKRITLLEREIDRIRAEIARKKQSLSQAEAFFKS